MQHVGGLATAGSDFSKVKVIGKRKEDGDNLVDLECTLTNQDGEVKVAGEATAALPSRG